MTAAPAPAAPGSSVLRTRGLRVVLGGRAVLDGVDVDVRAGEAVALLGPNGSGKTTLVRTLVGLQAPTDGVVEVFGRPAGDRADRARIGYVPQRTTATTGVPATVREVVASGRVRRQRRLRPASRADRAAVDAALDAVRLRARGSEPVSALSGGQQQRVLVARALAAEPEVLVLDEPTSAADAATEVAIAGTLGSLRERGVTLVLVTHHLGPVAAVVDRAVTLENGRVVADGPVDVDLPHGADHHSDSPAASPTGLRGAL